MQVSRRTATIVISEQIEKLIDREMVTRGVWGENKRLIFLNDLDRTLQDLTFAQVIPHLPRTPPPPRLTSLLDVDWGDSGKGQKLAL